MKKDNDGVDILQGFTEIMYDILSRGIAHVHIFVVKYLNIILI